MLREKKAAFTFGCLPVLKIVEKVRQEYPLKTGVSLGGDRQKCLFTFSNSKKVWDRSVLLKTEVSFGRTEVSFEFCEKQKCPFSPFFGTEVSLSLFFLLKKIKR